MEDKLLPYQKDHINNLLTSLKKHKRALDASDTGTGKTYTTVALCRMLKLRPFIVCPKSVVSNWTSVLDYFEYTKNEYDITTYDQLINHKFLKKINQNKSSNVTQTLPKSNTDMIPDTTKTSSHPIKKSTEVNNCEWIFKNDKKLANKFLFIYDEAHKCKNKNTINAKILLSLSECDTNIILLSATVVDKPLYFIIVGYILKIYDSFQAGIDWMSDLCKNKKAGHPLLNVHNFIFPEYASRMCVDNLGDIFKNNEIRMEGIQMENYYDIAKQYNIINELMKNYSKNSLSKIQKIRQNIELLKVNTFVKMTNNYISEGKSVAIFVNFTETIVQLAKKLNTSCIIYGQQTIDERSKSINNFCEDKSRIIICNIQSGGAGISLHDTKGKHPRVSLISPTWSAQDLMQVLGRIHRATGKSDVVQQIIYCKDTFEENIGAIIKEKINNIRMLNNGTQNLKKDNMENILKNEYIKKKKNCRKRKIHI
jgi:superfamily II DNA or RNA helicase